MMASSSMTAKEAEQESTNGPNWLELPKDVATNIFQKLNVVEIVMSASQVCSLWLSICQDPLVWRTIDMTNLPNYPWPKLVELCRCAVERSCGHLEDISIEGFATDDLLKFIAQRANHLRRMQLLSCRAISNRALGAIVKKLPLLEELEISFIGRNLSRKFLEAIGRGCPLLKALKLNRESSYSRDKRICNVEAFAIAKTMPGLCHLHIVGNTLSDKGLLAILDGCPMLEYLDLQHCSKLDLSGSLVKRCHEQIKEIRFPIDSDSDFDSDSDYEDEVYDDSHDDIYSKFIRLGLMY